MKKPDCICSVTERFCIFVFILFLAVVLFFPSVTKSQTFSSDSFSSISRSSNIPSKEQIDNDVVLIGLWLTNIFGYEYVKGDYTLDMYLYFFWTNTNLSAIDWQFANGYPITPTSVTLIRNNSAGGVKYEFYRATAHLNTPPDASDFPFDQINITVSINLLTHGNSVNLEWLTNDTGTDLQFSNPGWETINIELDTFIHTYPLGIQVPRAEMIITQQRQRSAASISPFIPPLIFSLVSAVSFLFGLKEGSSVALRIGLNTSMLVTTLLFSFTIAGNIPPSSNMVLYSIFLLSILIFMVCNLVVTIIGVVGWVRYRDEKRTTLANQLGFVFSILVPTIFFFLQ